MGSANAEFNRLMSLLDYPMFIVTTAAGEQRAGCLVGFASQVSIDPPRFLAGLSVKNRTFRVACAAELMAVHLVAAEAEGLAELFGGETGDQVDKFSQCGWSPGPGGVPILDGLENWFAGRILSRSEMGDHSGFLLEPLEGHSAATEVALTSRRTRGIEPGHQP